MTLRLVSDKPPAPEEIDPDIKPFKDYAEMYWEAGWIPLPLPPRRKASPPNRTTGRHNPPDWEQVKDWISTVPEHSNIAVRLPPWAFGVDVDDYGDKSGLATMLLTEEELGVPVSDSPTWISSARTDGNSGIRYFYLPKELRGTQLPGKLGPGVEIIQHRHRYAVAPPSVHEDFERHYRWYSPGAIVDGSGTFQVPRLASRSRT